MFILKPSHALPLILSALAHFLLPLAHASDLDVGIYERGNGDDPSCKFGVVRGLKAGGDGYLAVRTGPGAKYRKIDEIGNGKAFYIFEQKGKWLGVIYDSPEPVCFSTVDKRPLVYDGKKGWIHRGWARTYKRDATHLATLRSRRTGQQVASSQQASPRLEPSGLDQTVENHLAALGFNPGSSGGATSKALNDFQKQYGLEVTNDPPAEHFILLKALADAKGLKPVSVTVSAPGHETAGTGIVGTDSSSVSVPEIAEPVMHGASNLDQLNRGNHMLTGLPAFALINDHAIMGESIDFVSSNWVPWAAWLQVNLPVQVPEIVDLTDEHALLAAHALFSPTEKRALVRELGVGFDLFAEPNELGDLRRIRRLQDLLYPAARATDNALRNELDEFTRPQFMSGLRAALHEKLAGFETPKPAPIVRIYRTELGEYDFDKKGFPIGTPRGGSNATVENPALYSVLLSSAEVYNKGVRYSFNSDAKEFPNFLPMEPAQAKALVDQVEAASGNEHRSVYLAAYGSLNSIEKIEVEKQNSESISVRFNTTISYMDITIDKGLQNVVHSFTPEGVDSETLEKLEAAGAKQKSTVFGLEFIADNLAHLLPKMLEDDRLVKKMFSSRIDLENADLSLYGIDRDKVARIIREEVRNETRNPTDIDFKKFLAFKEGQKNAESNGELVVPTAVYVRATSGDTNTIDPARPVDMIIQGLDGITDKSRFTTAYSAQMPQVNNPLRNRQIVAKPGAVLHPLAYFPVNSKSRIPVYLSIELDNNSINSTLSLPATQVRATTERPQQGYHQAFLNSTVEGELRGHVVLNLNEPAELVSLKNGEKAIVIHAAPKRVVLVEGETKHEFDLAENAGASGTGAAVSAPEELVLDAETSDLLVIRHMPDTVTTKDYERMLLGRWQYEARFRDLDEQPNWGRFFAFGAAKPGEAEIDSLLDSFREWSLARAASLPDKILTSTSKYSILNPGFGGFGNEYLNGNSLSTWINQCSSAERMAGNDKKYPEHKREMLQNACKYLAQNAKVPSNTLYNGEPLFLPAKYHEQQTAANPRNLLLPHGSVGRRLSCDRDDYCDAVMAELKAGSFADTEFTLNDIYVFDKYVDVSPKLAALARERNAEIQLELRVLNIERRKETVPSPLLEALRDTYAFIIEQELMNYKPEPFVIDEIVESNIFELAVLSAKVIDRKTNKVVAELPLVDGPQPDASLLQPIKRTLVAAPAEPYGHDIVGIQLGMSFDDADKIIREHMDVGNVFYADRSWSAEESAGNPRLYSSGIVYESKDAKEVIALYDDAPSAKKIVLGAIRQVVFEKGTVKPPQIFASAKQKYGAPELAAGKSQYWGDGSEIAPNCTGLLTAYPYQQRTIWRDQKDEVADWDPGTFRTSGVAVPVPSDQNRRSLENASDCPAGLIISFDTTDHRDWDRLVFRLSDRQSYHKHFVQSELMLQQGASVENNDQDGGVGIKF